MHSSMGLRWGWVLLSSVLLSACLVGDDTTEDYTISLPSKLPTYANGHYINFSYELYVSNGSVMSPSGGIRMTWTSPVQLLRPFSLDPLTVVQQQITEASPSGDERISMQYITQDTTGSMFLNAINGVTASTSYWPNENAILSFPTPPSAKKIFASPIDDGVTSLVGINQSAGEALDYYVLGGDTCKSDGSATVCTEIARFVFSDYTVTQVDNLETPLGKFDAYKIHYAGTMTRNGVKPVSSFFDYRVSCAVVDMATSVSFEGDLWIYPPIGPVKLRNTCADGSGSSIISFIAQINRTNLPH